MHQDVLSFVWISKRNLRRSSWLLSVLFGRGRKGFGGDSDNNEPVKVVVAESLDDIVYKSGKNVLIEFYAPWCGHCQKLAPVLDEVALAFQNDPSVIIAKLDAANDIPSDTFDVKGFLTIYFRSANGNVVVYEGGRTKEDFISFIIKSDYSMQLNASCKLEWR